MRTVAGPNSRVVVVGAGLAGLSAALHLAGRGREVTVVEREHWPGGRAGRLDIGGYRLDTGPTVLTMPDIIDDAFAAVGENRSADRLDLMPVDPAYRRRSPTAAAWTCTRDADAMADAGAEFAGAARPTATAAARLADAAVPRRVRRFHRRELRLAAVTGHPAAGPAGRAGRLPPVGRRWSAVHHRRAAAAGVHLPGAVRGCAPAARAGRVRRDRLHGHRRRRVLPPRRHAGGTRRAGRRRRRRRRRVPSTGQR